MSYEQTAFCGAVGRGEEIFWVNPAKKPYEAVKASLPFSRAQIEDAASRLSRFAPFINAANIEELTELFRLAERDIAQNANGKIVFFDVAVQVIILIRKGNQPA